MTDDRVTPYLPLKDYGIIGDCHTAALVSNSGSIDWLCLPRFDSPSVFARILDFQRGGFWSIQPNHGFEAISRYVTHTNILATHFKTGSGEAVLYDFMPIGGDQPSPTRVSMQSVFRIVEGIDGEVAFHVVCVPRPNYARDTPEIEPVDGDDHRLAFDTFLLIGSRPWHLQRDGQRAEQRFTISKGQRVAFGLHDVGDRDALSRLAPDPFSAFDSTRRYWSEWAAQCTYQGPYRDQVLRSCLALRLLHYTPTGAIVAAPTTSLPEEIGGVRNWDYRFAWLRDASFTLYALLLAGYSKENSAFFNWIVHTVKFDRTGLRILYPITADGDTSEHILDHLEGYRRSAPVRIGNAAVHQLQLDVFGEVFDALHFAWKTYDFDPSEAWHAFRPLADWVAHNWQLPGSGIWEVRGGPRHFVYGKVLCWVALDRAIKLAQGCGLEGDTECWGRERDAIRAAVFEHGWSERLNSFKQAFEIDRLDAALLRLSAVGFVDGQDPRMLKTIDAIMERLVVDGLCYRYLDAPDGVAGRESPFVLCSFWLVNALLLAGRDSEAQRIYEQMLGRMTELGLLSEEIETPSGEFLGNYPQAFSQIGVISGAVSLAHVGKVGKVPHEAAQAAKRAGSGGGGQGSDSFTRHAQEGDRTGTGHGHDARGAPRGERQRDPVGQEGN